METTQTQHFRGNKYNEVDYTFYFFFSFKSSMEGFSCPGETASTLPPKDIPSVNEDYQYAPLGFASPPVVFQVVWSVCAFVACEAT